MNDLRDMFLGAILFCVVNGIFLLSSLSESRMRSKRIRKYIMSVCALAGAPIAYGLGSYLLTRLGLTPILFGSPGYIAWMANLIFAVALAISGAIMAIGSWRASDIELARP